MEKIKIKDFRKQYFKDIIKHIVKYKVKNDGDELYTDQVIYNFHNNGDIRIRINQEGKELNDVICYYPIKPKTEDDKRRYRSISKRVLYSDYTKQIRNIKLHKLSGQPLNIKKTRKEIVEHEILKVGDFYVVEDNRLIKVTSRKKIIANIEEYSFRFNHANNLPKYYYIIDQEGSQYWTKVSDYNDGEILKEKYIGDVMDLEPICRLGTGKIKLRRGKWCFEDEQGFFDPIKKNMN